MEAKHTEGPWCYVSDDKKSHYYLEAQSKRYGQSSGWALLAEIRRHRIGSSDRVPPDDVQDANARRIVAAINACEGIPIEALESGIVVDALKARGVLRKM